MNPRGIGIVVIVLIVLGLGGWAWYQHEHPVPHDFSIPSHATSTPPQAAGSLDEHATYYDITASYPATTSFASLKESDAKAVDTMRQFEADTIAQFKKDGNFANLSHDDVQMLELDQRKETLDISYKSAVGVHSVSYIFTMVADTHGAHPNTYYKTFTFDTRTGQAVSLGELFSTGTYLAVLSNKARVLLPALIAKNIGVATSDVDMRMLNDGTAATAENFANWYVDGTNLVLIFPPYQVAAYAAGTQTLSIPLSEFGESIAARYR